MKNELRGRSFLRHFRGFISLPPLLNPVIFLLTPAHKNLPIFLPGKRSAPSPKRSFSPSAVGAGITHYTLQYRPSNGFAIRWLRSAIASNRFRSSGAAGPHAKSCAKGTLSPLDPLPRNRRFLWILPAEGSAAPFGFLCQEGQTPSFGILPQIQNGMSSFRYDSTFHFVFREKGTLRF